MNAIIKYYDDSRDVILPFRFEHFRISLAEMLGIEENYLSQFSIFYYIKESIFYVTTSESYKILLDKLKNKETTTIEIEYNNSEDKDKKNEMMRKSFLNFSKANEEL